MSSVDSHDTMWVKNFVKIAPSHTVSEINVFLRFYTEIQDGHQKWWKNDFWEKLPVDSTDILRVKNFIELTISHTISQINQFFVLHRNSRLPPKMAGKRFLGKVASRLCITCRSKLSEINVRAVSVIFST